jgi:polyisoprenyl-phosphate glycosyltransferase
MKKKLISIVIPMFNEEDNIIPLYDELCSKLTFLTYFSEYEIIAVNDGSSDTILVKLKQLAHKVHPSKNCFFYAKFWPRKCDLCGNM